MFKKSPKVEQGRRRPVSGGSSSAVFSYHANRSAQAGAQGRINEATREATAARQAKRLDWIKRGPALAGFVVLGIIVLVNLGLGTQARVVPVGDSKGEIFLRGQQDYTQAAHEVLASSVFNRTKLSVNTDKVAQELRKRFPELTAVTVSVPFIGQQPTVYIEPASPRLLLSTVAGNVFVVDSTGRALISANQASHLEKLGLPVVSDQSGLDIQAGSTALPSTSVSFITEVAGQLEAKGLSITSLVLPVGTSEMDVRLGGATYFVKFNLRGDARAEVGAFLAVKQQLERERKTPSSYVDVRVEDRAYYK